MTARLSARAAGALAPIPSRPRAIALAGGGPLGAIYELGALLALDECLTGAKLSDFDMFVGVSSGAYFAAGLANGFTAREMHALFIENEGRDDPFDPRLLMRPAFGEFAGRLVRLPGLVLSSAWNFLRHPLRRGSLMETFDQLLGVLPSGVFDSRPAGRYLERLFTTRGRTNDFRQLHKKLFVVATELDTGRTTAFGAKGADHIPITEAVLASSALPGLFPPVEIGGRTYVDGVLKKTMHASVALQAGAKLLIGINPLVPFDERRAPPTRQSRIVEKGLPLVLSQTFRAIIHSRMQTGMDRYAKDYPDADVILFEPDANDETMFFTNVFSYAERRQLSRHAYLVTRAQIRRRFDTLAPVLARHGLGLDRAVLAEEHDKPGASDLSETGKRLGRTLDALEAELDRTKGDQPDRPK